LNVAVDDKLQPPSLVKHVASHTNGSPRDARSMMAALLAKDRAATMLADMKEVDKQKTASHYDLVSEAYRSLLGGRLV
jgi:hypothetical protein